MNYQTTKLTQAIITAATTAVTDYNKEANRLYENLDTTVKDLLKQDCFSGDAANGFKEFYDKTVTPALTESLPSLTKAIEDILTNVGKTFLDTVDPKLGEFNKNPGAGAEGAAEGN